VNPKHKVFVGSIAIRYGRKGDSLLASQMSFVGRILPPDSLIRRLSTYTSSNHHDTVGLSNAGLAELSLAIRELPCRSIVILLGRRRSVAALQPTSFLLVYRAGASAMLPVPFPLRGSSPSVPLAAYVLLAEFDIDTGR
jgi:hypothetical protein